MTTPNKYPTEKLVFLFVLIGMSVLFVASSIAFFYLRSNENMPPVQLPRLFIVSTLSIVVSGFFLLRSQRFFRQDKLSITQKYLLGSLGLVLLFIVLQYFVYRDLINQEHYINSNQSLSFLYFLFGLHLVHVLLGIPFLLIIMRKIYLTIRNKRGGMNTIQWRNQWEDRLKMLIQYWHFVEGLWIYLILLFFLHNLT